MCIIIDVTDAKYKQRDGLAMDCVAIKEKWFINK